MSDQEHPESHLSRIATLWTMLRNAHGTDLDAKLEAQAQFFERYQRAVEKYLLAVMRDQNAAEEVFSEFAENFLAGGFHKADRERGQFRFYLKRSLVNAVRSYQRKQGRMTPAIPLDENVTGTEDETLSVEFEKAWHQELVDKAWEALREKEAKSGKPYFTILELMRDHSDLTGTELHAITQQHLQKAAYPASTWRKDLSRARMEYAGLLVQEIGRSIGSQSLEEIEEEAAALGLLTTCQRVIDKLRTNANPDS